MIKASKLPKFIEQQFPLKMTKCLVFSRHFPISSQQKDNFVSICEETKMKALRKIQYPFNWQKNLFIMTVEHKP